jgi:type IV pilus biogenesis protein CpaD/CtpE
MRKILLTIAATFSLAACTNKAPQMDLNTGFGDAYYHNIAAQVVNPNPANAGSGAPDVDGQRARIAIDRYNTTTTIAPVTTTTTSVGGQ